VLAGARLEDVEHRGLDRSVSLRFTGEAGAHALVAELFGRRPNVLLLDCDSNIVEAVQRSPEGRGALGEPYVAPPRPSRPDPALLPVEDVAAILAPQLAGGVAPAAAITQALSGVAPHWAAEAASATPTSPEGLARALLALIDRIRAGPWAPGLLLDDDGNPSEALPLALTHVPAERQEPAVSLAAAVERLARFRGRLGDLEERRRRLVRVLKHTEQRLQSRRRKLLADADVFSRAGEQQRMGEILVQHQRTVPRGLKEAVLPDPAGEPGATVTIPLDPTLPPLGNVERLFKAARRARRGAGRVAARMAETEEALARAASLRERLGTASDRDALDAVHHTLEKSRLLSPRELATLPEGAAGAHRPARPAPEASAPAGLSPRRFLSSDGIPILVGKNPEGNDYLTGRLARSNDLWLHVQGRGGSHVVVRSAGRPGGVPRRTLVQAAQLAAYYSQARDDGKVPVDYTLKKFVRKPRKAKPGLVTISHEKTIIVAPDKGLVGRLSQTSPAVE
jgi:predicted ribosome quality control (RQC) complex YloA/Tae2 family protein